MTPRLLAEFVATLLVFLAMAAAVVYCVPVLYVLVTS
jgi:hypothetical protein